MVKRLPPELTESILALRKQAYEDRLKGDFASAERLLLKAWDMIPEPKDDWDMTSSLLRGIVTFYREAKREAEGLKWLARWEQSMSDGPEVERDSFAGQILFDLGLLDAAYLRLHAAYRAYKTRPFQGSDPKYLAFLRARMATEGLESEGKQAQGPADDDLTELPDEIHERVEQLSAQAEAFFAKGQYKQAIDLYWTALALLPPPETKWEAATWLLTGIGDAHYLNGKPAQAVDALFNALNCPDAHANAFINLRLGQALYDAGRRDQAMNYLTRAYALDGEKIFSGGGEQHLAALKRVIKT